MKNLYAVILAGGAGTRFWPLSRKSKPKQFLNITGKGTLLQETVARVKTEIKPDNIIVVTNAEYKKPVADQLRRFGVPVKNILLEPSGKNTAPAICWAASLIYKRNPEAVMAVLPSDHLILNKTKFLTALRQAVELAQKQSLVTFGIVPTRPETGYGYIKIKKVKNRWNVQKFTEKPSLAKANKFLKTKQYVWNSGMFIWRADVILEEFKKYLPKIYRLLSMNPNPSAVRRVWSKLPAISVDYGILEKTKKGAAVRADKIGWSDLGSWESLADVLSADRTGNIIKGNVINLACRDTLVWGDKRVIAAIGLKDIVIVDTDDALLICKKDQSQKVRDVVSKLKKHT
ncbi:MAG: mannose-1-phosphate guanylyltransferase [Candidatus Omnitrophica bacterium]|nr:mannose-1-phosphate guanylyltransferase [Candidatus Omnitrophota bacterium]